MVSSPNHSSKEWLFRQYDNMVMCDTIFSSESDAAIVESITQKKQLQLPVIAAYFVILIPNLAQSC